MKTKLFLLLPLLYMSCSPLKSSPSEEKHQLELTLHQIQTNLDDLRHDLNCFQTELQIIDGKVKYQENEFASKKTQSKLEEIANDTKHLQEELALLKRQQTTSIGDLQQFSTFSNQVKSTLEHCKQKIEFLERNQSSYSEKISQITRLKSTLESLVLSMKDQNNQEAYSKVYKVRPGDSLEKIARKHKTNVELIKNINQLNRDLIVVGQELKIP